MLAQILRIRPHDDGIGDLDNFIDREVGFGRVIGQAIGMLWPVALIGVGLWLVRRGRKERDTSRWTDSLADLVQSILVSFDDVELVGKVGKRAGIVLGDLIQAVDGCRPRLRSRRRHSTTSVGSGQR